MGRTVYVDAEVAVDLDDVQTEDLMAEMEDRGALSSTASDLTPQQTSWLIERAYLDARAMPPGVLPQSLRDLLWKVHGRAI
jgi:hypothetical protein